MLLVNIPEAMEILPEFDYLHLMRDVQLSRYNVLVMSMLCIQHFHSRIIESLAPQGAKNSIEYGKGDGKNMHSPMLKCLSLIKIDSILFFILTANSYKGLIIVSLQHGRGLV